MREFTRFVAVLVGLYGIWRHGWAAVSGNPSSFGPATYFIASACFLLLLTVEPKS